MPGVDAYAKFGVMVLDHFGDRLDLGILMARTVIVNADGHIIFSMSLSMASGEAGDGVGSPRDIEDRGPWRTRTLACRRLRPFQVPQHHTRQRYAKRFDLWLDLLNYLGVRCLWEMRRKYFPVVQAEFLGRRQSLTQIGRPPSESPRSE